MAEPSKTRRGAPWATVVGLIFILALYVGYYFLGTKAGVAAWAGGPPAVFRYFPNHVVAQSYVPLAWVEVKVKQQPVVLFAYNGFALAGYDLAHQLDP